MWVFVWGQTNETHFFASCSILTYNEYKSLALNVPNHMDFSFLVRFGSFAWWYGCYSGDHITYQRFHLFVRSCSIYPTLNVTISFHWLSFRSFGWLVYVCECVRVPSSIFWYTYAPKNSTNFTQNTHLLYAHVALVEKDI